MDYPERDKAAILLTVRKKNLPYCKDQTNPPATMTPVPAR
jgi:hypothetical protein